MKFSILLFLSISFILSDPILINSQGTSIVIQANQLWPALKDVTTPFYPSLSIPKSNQTIAISSLTMSNRQYVLVYTNSSDLPVVFSRDVSDQELVSSLGSNVVSGLIVRNQCNAYCSINGVCNEQGDCLCRPGFTGAGCDVCLVIFFFKCHLSNYSFTLAWSFWSKL